MSDLVKSFKIDKTALSVVSLTDASDEKEHWIRKSPQERLAAMEFMRQINYGKHAASSRLQRVLTVTQLEKD